MRSRAGKKTRSVSRAIVKIKATKRPKCWLGTKVARIKQPKAATKTTVVVIRAGTVLVKTLAIASLAESPEFLKVW